MPFDDDAADDVTGFRPPPHPDDRLWRHPSEVYAAEPAIPLRTHGRLWPWGIAAVGTAGVMLAGAGTLILGVRDRVDGDRQQQASVAPLGSLPSPHVEGQSLAPRSSEGVTDLTEIARLSDDLAPSLVHVDGAAGPGSGVVVGDEGLTLTSAGLVDGLDEVTVTLQDGQQVTGEVKGSDPLTDIAVLDLPGDPAPAAMADPSGVGAGEGVLAMGAAAGGGRPATTLGPLSPGHLRLERSGLPAVDGLLHVNLPAQPEARGGPLVDQHGTVVGITIWTDDGATYATPIDVAAKVAEDMLTVGRAEHAWLGIHGRDVGESDVGESSDAGATSDDRVDSEDGVNSEGVEEAGPMVASGGTDQVLSGEATAPPTTAAEEAAEVAGATQSSDEEAGVVVVTVDPSTPAAAALQPGDVIIALGDQPVIGLSDLAAAVAMLRPGDTVVLTVDRGGHDITIPLTVDERPADP